jgi:rod shape determining protein RodA
VTLGRGSAFGPRRVPGYDWVLAALTLAVSLFGVVMVYSATRDPLLAARENPHYYLERQLAFVVLGAIVMLVVSRIDYRLFEHLATPAYVISILALLAVKSPLGSNALGSQRWFSFGPIQIQPSEFTVLAMILAVATYCERRPDGLSMRDVVRMLLMAAIPIFLVYLQPDLGTAIIMVIVLLVMLVIAGVPPRFLLLLSVLGAGITVLAVFLGVLQHYQVVRLTGFIGSTPYQVAQAKAAIGSGGLWGEGFFHGHQTNLGFVPEQQTDFIFTAVGEQLGFIGAAGLIVALAAIAGRMLRASMRARDHLGRLLAVGVFTFFAFSCFQNVGMIMGIMPVTGIPLPFLSYGGSAAVCFFLAVGIVLSVTNRRSGARARAPAVAPAARTSA